MKTITYNGTTIAESSFIVMNNKIVFVSNVPLYVTLIMLNQEAKSKITNHALAEYEVPPNADAKCTFRWFEGEPTVFRKNQLEEIYRLHWPYIIQGKDAKTGDVEGLIVTGGPVTFDEWKRKLVKIIVRETGQQEHEIKLKEAECLQCYNDGMPPYFAFRESFGD